MAGTSTPEKLSKEINRLNEQVAALMVYVASMEAKLNTGVDRNAVVTAAKKMIPMRLSEGAGPLVVSDYVTITAAYLEKGQKPK